MEWDISTDWNEKAITVKDKSKLKEKALKRIIENDRLHFVIAKNLSDLCPKPEKNQQYRIITEKSFNAYALILDLLQSVEIEEMYLAIYRINESTVQSIIDYIEAGKIKKATFVISNFFNQTKKPETWAKKLKDFADKNESTNHIYIHNHSKILAIRTNDGNHYIFEGSGNMSDNARIEQYIYENNEEVFSFHKEWMTNIVSNGI